MQLAHLASARTLSRKFKLLGFFGKNWILIMNYVYISLSLKSSSTLIYAVYATLSTLRYELCVYLFGFFTQRNATQRNATHATQRNATLIYINYYFSNFFRQNAYGASCDSRVYALLCYQKTP
jgi:hypothetical protein